VGASFGGMAGRPWPHQCLSTRGGRLNSPRYRYQTPHDKAAWSSYRKARGIPHARSVAAVPGVGNARYLCLRSLRKLWPKPARADCDLGQMFPANATGRINVCPRSSTTRRPACKLDVNVSALASASRAACSSSKTVANTHHDATGNDQALLQAISVTVVLYGAAQIRAPRDPFLPAQMPNQRPQSATPCSGPHQSAPAPKRG